MSGLMLDSARARPDASAARRTPFGSVQIGISARNVLLAQTIVIVVALFGSIAAKCLSLLLDAGRYPGLLALLDKLDVNGEMNIPSWWSSLQLSAAAVLLTLIGLAVRSGLRAGATPWFLLSLLFVGLSLEETAAIRDLFNPVLRRWLGASGFFHFAWVIPGALFVAAVGASFLRFLIQLDRRTRTLFLLAGAMYVGGALGLEILGGYLTTRYGQDHLGYILATTLEEGCEMWGVALFVYALMRHLERNTAGLKLAVSR